MRLLSFLLVVCALTAGVSANPGDPHAKEHQNTPLWINIPVPPRDLDGVLDKTGLTADVYTDGNAYVQILTYNLDSLQTWLLNSWADVTFTPGWVMKLNILVNGPKGPGYLITNIDFQIDNPNFFGWFTGVVRNVGALFDQKIPSHLCSFKPGYPTAGSNALSFDFGCTYWQNRGWKSWFVTDGFKGQTTYTNATGAGNGIANDAFVKFAVVRNNKYEKQTDGAIVWADVTLPGVQAGLDQWYPLQASSNSWSVSMLQTRLGLTANYPICSLTDKNYCFWGGYYGLIDHENTILQAAQTNGVAVDGALTAPDSTTSSSSSSTSNNLIWLYGILVGSAATIFGALAMYAAITYHARGKQVLKTTAQHVEQMP